MRTPVLALILLAVLGCKAPLTQLPPSTPQRPTVSSDPTTTAKDTYEIELGAAIDPSDTFDSPMALKYGAGENTELFVGWSPYEFADRPGPRDAEGIGDTLIGVRHRFLDETEDWPATALQLTTKLPTGDDDAGLSSGEIDFFAAGTASKRLGSVGTTLFYELGVTGDPGVSDTSLQHTVAAAGTIRAADRWNVFGELAGVFQPEADSEVGLATIGASFELSPDLVLDAALVIGLSNESPDFQILFGSTSNLGTQGLLRFLR